MKRLLYGAFLLATATPLGAQEPLPERLSDTGLYSPGTREIAEGILPFSPQYPLWSDGARKRRWLALPPGATIDATDPDAWEFPPGTRAWKEFGYGHPVETRYIERLEDGTWRFATYVWDADGENAILASEEGMAFHTVEDAPGGRYPIPSRDDCLACHEGGAGPLLGLNALQLSPIRDLKAPHAEALEPDHVDLPALVAAGILQNLDVRLLDQPPQITATSDNGRAALGYLHSNCGICHNDKGPLWDLDFSLLQSALPASRSTDRTLVSTLLRESESVAPGVDRRIVPGHAEMSTLLFRLRSRNKVWQMPPLGRRVPDDEAISLIEHWINQDLNLIKEH